MYHIKEEIRGRCENLENESVAKKKKKEIASNLNNFFQFCFLYIFIFLRDEFLFLCL